MFRNDDGDYGYGYVLFFLNLLKELLTDRTENKSDLIFERKKNTLTYTKSKCLSFGRPPSLLSAVRVGRVQLLDALHVCQSHFGSGQQLADHLQPAARLVERPARGRRPLWDRQRVVRRSAFFVLRFVHETRHLVFHRFHVPAGSKHALALFISARRINPVGFSSFFT